MKYVEDLYECKNRVYYYTLLGFCWDCWLLLAPQACVSFRFGLLTYCSDKSVKKVVY